MDKKLQKGIVAVLIANLVNVAFSLATNFLLPKYLSIESYAGIKEFQLYVSYVGLFHLGFVDGIYLKYGGKTLGKDVDKEFSADLSTIPGRDTPTPRIAALSTPLSSIILFIMSAALSK